MGSDDLFDSKQKRIKKTDIFTLQELYRWMDELNIYSILYILGHKEAPKNPEATIRGTMNKLTNNNYLERINRGEYRLKEKGTQQMKEAQKAWDTFRKEVKEHHSKPSD